MNIPIGPFVTAVVEHKADGGIVGWDGTGYPPRLVVYYDPSRPSRAAAFVDGMKRLARPWWFLRKWKERNEMEKKPLKDWTYGETKELCMSMDHCYNCELRSGETSCSVADMIRGKSRPMEWEYPELKPRQLTGSELTICRALGAKWLTHQVGARDVWLTKNKPERKVDEKGRIYYESGEDIGEIAIVNTSLFPSIKEQDDFSVIVG